MRRSKIIFAALLTLMLVFTITSVYSAEDLENQQTDDNAVNQETIQTKEVKEISNNVKEKEVKQDTIAYTANSYADLVNKVNQSKTATGEVTISLEPGNYNAIGQITWGGSTNKKLTINGNGLVLDGQQKYKFALVQMNNILVLRNITLQNYKSSGPGGTIQCMGQVDIEDSVFINNTATSSSGGAVNIQNLFNQNSTINNCQFISNDAPKGGAGAVNINGAIVTINNTKFINNTGSGSTGYGGALYNMGVLTMENTLFDSNSHTNIGGALATDNKLNMTNVTFTNNNATRYAGAIHYGNNYLSIKNSEFKNNTAGQYGGVLAADRGELTVENTTFAENSAQDGAVLYTNGKTSITNSTIKENNATNGAIIRVQNNEVTLDENTFQLNNATTETLYLPSCTTKLDQNTYNNTTIGVDEYFIALGDDKTDYYPYEDISILNRLILSNPEYYDEDIVENDKILYYTVGDVEETYEVVGYIYELEDLEPGVYNAYVEDPIGGTSNTLTFTVKEAPKLVIEPLNVEIGQTVDINVAITEDDRIIETINDGRVYFKINGKIVRDDTTNKVVYVDVVEGKATLEDYTVPANWNNDTAIEAVYSGGSIPKTSSDVVNPTVSVPGEDEPEFSVEDVTTTAGSEVTITVTTKNLDGGKVVLKVNGKTVKADDGKLYTKVESDTTTFTYTVPKTLKADEYIIKAVCTSGTTKLEAESKLIVE
ncbi:MAG: hypothetical protein BZ136_09045 [Methanosphaera sp. rholeuAM74]|nr:MAG: hypothetical protein BZ136_09045 [Methanosphaera sp. rholeuAM74]